MQIYVWHVKIMIVNSICVAACTDCGKFIVDFEWQFVDMVGSLLVTVLAG